MTTQPPGKRLTAAFDYARIAHGAQVRKGTAIPYLSHLMGVCSLVMDYGGDEDQAIAGLLHDLLEDCGAHHEPILRRQFGERVANIVLACTDGVPDANHEKPEWRPRKEAYLRHLRTADDDALLVSGCDKLHNARAILADLRAGDDVFARFKGGEEGTLWYYRELVKVLSDRLGRDRPLVKELAATVSAMRAQAHGDRDESSSRVHRETAKQ
ncbi:MAG TPA: HD domain-containing protein [Rhizomicrobium sp.]